MASSMASNCPCNCLFISGILRIAKGKSKDIIFVLFPQQRRELTEKNRKKKWLAYS